MNRFRKASTLIIIEEIIIMPTAIIGIAIRNKTAISWDLTFLITFLMIIIVLE